MRFGPIITADAKGGLSRTGIAMSAMTYSKEFLGPATSERPSSVPLASDAPAKFEHACTSFARPGPDVLSRSIPVVFIGRNRAGLWVARDADGKFGGLFWRKGSALHFAKTNAGPAGYAALFPRARFELDLPNHGNPLVAGLAAAKLLLGRHLPRPAALRRWLGAAFAILLVAGALAGIIALKTAIYLSHLNY
jgi:hypothetical protein